MNKKIYKSITLVLLLAMLVSITGCFRYKEKEYYANTDNFISATGTVKHLSYRAEDNDLILGFSDLTETFGFSSFVIADENLQILINTEALRLIYIGKTISFISAPKCFSNGSALPIVSLTVDGKVLLDFETGWKNLMKNYR